MWQLTSNILATSTASYLVFQMPGDAKLKISQEALHTMLLYAQHNSFDKEAGGVLLGRFLKDCSDVVVDLVTVPMSNDKRMRYSFYRSKKQHQQIIDQYWKESNGTVTYLGEWHTHPEAFPVPSKVDETDWLRRMVADTYSEILFFIIVGTQEVSVWYGSNQTNSLIYLELIT
jgi:integrative and conjugative element protein (TIGR02256 family)